MSGDLEDIAGEVPGARTADVLGLLQAYESRNVTYVAKDFPIAWESASGATVTDVDGNRYIDLTAAFGVANAGHCNARVSSAIAEQAKRLMHGMGDVHPSALRARLLERLVGILPEGLSKAFLATTGSEAIEAALKTAMLATGQSRFASYRGSYHGLSFGALSVGGIDAFRAPFAAALPAQPVLLEYPREFSGLTAHRAAARARDVLAKHGDLAALVIEPIQGRAGCVVPPPGYLAAIRQVCNDLRIVMIVDEIFTGFGRTGTWFAVNRERVVPDVICVGKAMGSGFPISAAVARPDVMDAWPLSTGEALHTSTYLGNPMGCAAALATIDEFERLQLPRRAAELGIWLEARLAALRSHPGVTEVRGCGLLWGIELRDAATAGSVVKHALARGVILLPSGIAGETITIAPPLVISENQLDRAIAILDAAVRAAE
jgi:4-aminobutyrate aminotransferase-like enzyme